MNIKTPGFFDVATSRNAMRRTDEVLTHRRFPERTILRQQQCGRRRYVRCGGGGAVKARGKSSGCIKTREVLVDGGPDLHARCDQIEFGT